MEISGLFDTHCHLDDEQFDHDRLETMQRATSAGVALCVTAGSDLASSRACVRLAEAHSWVYAAAGIHPHAAEQADDGYQPVLRTLTESPRVVAIGEIGLDYYYDNSPRQIQRERLIEQLTLADDLQKPVILHVREAHGDLKDILTTRGTSHAGGVIHCFTGSYETALQYIRLGYHIAFGGALTYKNAQRIRQVAKDLPIEKLLIETDSPYLSPVPLRGKRNEPANVALVCQALAEVKGITSQEAADITRANGLTAFKITR